MARKHIFIGMGGSGCQTVASVKYKIYERLKETPSKNRVDILNESNRFIFIDTDAGDIGKRNAEYLHLFESGRKKMISHEEFVDLGSQNPYEIYRKAKSSQDQKINKRIVEMCDPDVADRMDNRALKFGAGAFRMKSRVAFARKSDEFCTKLRAAIQDLKKVENNADEDCTICYWVVGSCAGGTGSGIINDVLYFVNMIHKSVVDEADPKVTLLLYMPDYYITVNENNKKYPNNGFAVMKELETFEVWSKHDETNKLFHRFALVDDYEIFDDTLPYRPFEICIPIDYTTSKNNNMGSLKNMYSNTAEMLFYLHDGEGADGFESFMDNNRDGAHTKDEDRSFLLPMGYVALKKPIAQFDEYMDLRIKSELLEFGILGKEIKGEELEESVRNIFNNEIKNRLYHSNMEDSYLSILKTECRQQIEQVWDDSYVQKCKVNDDVNPDTIARFFEKNLLEDIINVKSEKLLAEKTNDLTEALWQKAEDLIIEKGLNTARRVMMKLDEFCSNLYNREYKDATENDNAILIGLELDKKSKLNELTDRKYIIDKLTGDGNDGGFEDVCKIDWTKLELPKTAREEALTYMAMVRSTLEQAVDAKLKKDCMEVIAKICTNGVLDNISSRMKDLEDAANNLVSSETGPVRGYKKLANKFYNSHADVTTITLPDISSFTNGAGWLRDNYFERIYGQIIEPDSMQYRAGLGFAPDRTKLADFIKEIPTSNLKVKKEMIKKNYIVFIKVEGKEQVEEKVRLFTQREMGSAQACIEDILYFATLSLKSRMNKNTDIRDKWYSKDLYRFFEEMSIEERDKVVNSLKPSLFFSMIEGKKDGNIDDREFCVAPNEDIAKQIFGFENRSNQKFIDCSDENLMYILAAKLGISFDYYKRYEDIKRKYESEVQKEYYHFHQEFARSGGDSSLLRFNNEPSPIMVDFVRYLMIDQYGDLLKNHISMPTEEFEKNKYASTPILFENKRVYLATERELEQADNGTLMIRLREGVFASIDGITTPYTVVSEKFAETYSIAHYDKFVDKFIRTIMERDRILLEENYVSCHKQLMNSLDAKYVQAKKANNVKEMATLESMLLILKNQLSTYKLFIK